jgi:RNA polymerase sigma-70 factor (ECF subfamily)
VSGPTSEAQSNWAEPPAPGTKRADEMALVRRSVNGDIEAFRCLYDRHRSTVYSVALRLLGNSHDAEDATQEVFLLLHRKLGSFRGQSSLSTWIYRLALNVCFSILRRRKRRPDSWDPALFSSVRSAKDGTTWKPLLEQAIGKLPDGARSVFLLHDVEGLEHEEIANLLGISSGTSKSQLFKARQALRRHLNDPLELEERHWGASNA